MKVRLKSFEEITKILEEKNIHKGWRGDIPYFVEGTEDWFCSIQKMEYCSGKLFEVSVIMRVVTSLGEEWYEFDSSGRNMGIDTVFQKILFVDLKEKLDKLLEEKK